ncbi:hypothetical protein VA7868_02048 [Vibrio aerogenes CECT 7868]|uniref:Uncharacterized protein n=1 Tax=Vibrio aerogenes CECT 7868 TaxID=1216006 RepID=A0A1M5YWN6_9VIBR|nr:hypothetical protein [Vibrio aerogenes]SHI16409.1 hypothetical protein VA7868_02048 [Vibrio aerogenes CECT 7868]
MCKDYVSCFFEEGEIISFFKGEGGYFYRDPNWGEHLYYPSLRIALREINGDTVTSTDFINAFDLFVRSLGDNEADSEHFWQNIYAFYLCLKNKDIDTISDFFEPGYPCITDVSNYFNRVKNKYDSTFYLDEIKKKFPTAGILKL